MCPSINLPDLIFTPVFIKLTCKSGNSSYTFFFLNRQSERFDTIYFLMKNFIISAMFFMVFAAIISDVSAASDMKTYKVKAVVKKIYRSDKKITLDHDEIKGYMKAMTMTFPVKDSTIFEKVTIGTSGIATIKVKQGFPSVTHFTKAKYQCPMHSKEMSDRPGKCPVCGMDYEKNK